MGLGKKRKVNREVLPPGLWLVQEEAWIWDGPNRGPPLRPFRLTLTGHWKWAAPREGA